MTQVPVQTWGSYCGKGDATVGRAVTSTFRLNGPFEIYLTGDPTGDGLSLVLENISDGTRMDLTPDQEPAAFWQLYEFSIPDSWRGKELRLVAQDRSTGPMGWFGFSGPSVPRKTAARREATKILRNTGLFTTLIFVPGFALSALAIVLGVRGTLKLGLILLAGVSIPGYVLFFTYVLSAKIGHVLSATTPYLFGVSLILLLVRLGRSRARLLKPLLAPLLLTFFASLGILALGYSYGGLDNAITTQRTRFSHKLPSDNWIPYLFVQGLEHGHIPTPIFLNWLSSDRPPLQAGMILAVNSWVRDEQLSYGVASAVMQSLWILALWLMLRAIRASRLTTALVLGTTYMSGFTIVNTFYVWPKLLAAAYIVAFAIPIIAVRPQRRRGAWWIRLLMGFLLACSLLAHGGALFSLLGLAPLVLIKFRKDVFKESAIIAGLAILLYAPWIAYQKLVDPPGDRLLKYHFAGVEQVSSKTALHTIVGAYGNESFDRWVYAKVANLGPVFGHEMEFLREITQFRNPNAQADIRGLEFFFFLPSLGFVGFGFVFLLFRYRKRRLKKETEAAEVMLLWSLASAALWILLMFKPATTVLHQGPYAMVMMTMTSSVLAFRAIPGWFAVLVCVVQCAIQWVIYAPDLVNIAFPSALAATLNRWMMGLHVLALIGFVLTMVWAFNLRITEATRSADKSRDHLLEPSLRV